MYRKLDEIQEMLAPYEFVRVHRSFLVNMRYVYKIRSYVLYLTDQTEPSPENPPEAFVEISVPKSRYAYVKREFEDYRKRHRAEDMGSGFLPKKNKNGKEVDSVEYDLRKLYDKNVRFFHKK